MSDFLDEPGHYEPPEYATIVGAMTTIATQYRDAKALVERWTPPSHWQTPDRVIVLGVGGSAIGADIVAAALRQGGGPPLEVWRGHGVPQVDANTLVVACSFSGDTQETVRPFQQLLGSPAMLLAITRGGALASIAREHDIPLLHYHSDGAPRLAVGYAIVPLLAALDRLSALPQPPFEDDPMFSMIEAAARSLAPDMPTRYNAAKQLALDFHGRLPIIVGSGPMRPIALRWQTQIAENAKQLAIAAELPEAAHNLIEGFVVTNAPVRVAVLHPSGDEDAARFTRVLAEAGIPHESRTFNGTALWAALLACVLGDWMSTYLAVLNGIERPLSTPYIASIKQQASGRAPATDPAL